MTAPTREPRREAPPRAWLALSPILAAVIGLAASEPARACTDQVLDLIGSKEGPSGYSHVAESIQNPPPLTRMTVAEVMEWQRQGGPRGLARTAAGRYQLSLPALTKLVAAGAVRPEATFDAATQDALAARLLAETGYVPGTADPDIANRIADIWGAMPLVNPQAEAPLDRQFGGAWGNHALISAAEFMAVLGCRMNAAETNRTTASILAGARVGISLDKTIETMATAVESMLSSLAAAAATLLLTLFAVDLVLRGGKWAVSGRFETSLGELAFRILAIALFAAILLIPGELLDGTRDAALALAGDRFAQTIGQFSIQNYVASNFALILALVDQVNQIDTPVSDTFVWKAGIKVVITPFLVAIALCIAVQVFAIIYWNFRVIFVSVAGIIAVGFGGLRPTSEAPKTWILTIIGGWMAVLAITLVIAVFTPMSWAFANLANPVVALACVLVAQIMTVAAILHFPGQVLHIMKGASIATTNVKIPIKKSPIKSLGKI